MAARQLIQDNFGGNSANALMVVVHSPDQTTTSPAFQAVVRKATRTLEADGAVSQVVQPMPGQTISRDGHTAVLLAGAAGISTGRFVAAVALCLVVSLSSPLVAQEATGRIVGMVTDPQGIVGAITYTWQYRDANGVWQNTGTTGRTITPTLALNGFALRLEATDDAWDAASYGHTWLDTLCEIEYTLGL